MTQRNRPLFAMFAAVAIAGCANTPARQTTNAADPGLLVGAWNSKISFRTGPFAPVKDLEFMSAYNAGGTMTESSNYDEAANATPPAYGIWKQTSPGKFETKYLFFMTRPPDPKLGEPKSGDWWPAGHGELTETITLSGDGQTYTSTIKVASFDRAGKVIADGGGEGTASGSRIAF